MVRVPEEGFASHPIADMFPMMSEENIKELAEDIRAYGLQNRIELYEGKILDGRNRYEALKLLGKHQSSSWFNDMTGAFFNMEDELVRYVVSRNLHRRHLTDGQKAEIGLKAKQMQVEMLNIWKSKKEERDRQDARVENFPPPKAQRKREKGKSRDLAAAGLDISGRTIDHAEKVFGKDNTATPELQQAVRESNASVSAAAKVASLPPAQQRMAVAGGKKGVARAAKRVSALRSKASSSGVQCGKPQTAASSACQIDQAELEGMLGAFAQDWAKETWPTFIRILRNFADNMEEELSELECIAS